MKAHAVVSAARWRPASPHASFHHREVLAVLACAPDSAACAGRATGCAYKAPHSAAAESARRHSLLITARWVFCVALADLGRDRTCKKPKGQSLFFLVEHGHPEMLPALEAEEVREMLERTMLQSCVGV